MSKEISLGEVKNHEKDVWMVISNNVYDVKSFLEEHPGGADALLEYAGRDATQAFEDVGHSDDARSLMKKYQIGTLPQAEQQCASACIDSGGGGGGWLKWALILGAVVVIAGFAYTRMKK